MTLRWEWSLGAGDHVAATLDPEAGTESVYLGDKLVSSAPRGTKKEGHSVLRGQETLAIVTFDPRSPICVLREPDGLEIAPRTWPTTTSRNAVPKRPKPARSFGVPLAFGALAALGVGLYLALRAFGFGHGDSVPTTGYRAPNGLFIAHYPATFTLRPAVLPAGMSGATLEDAETGDAIVIAAAPEASRDLWALYQRLGAEALANVPRADGSWEERERKDEPCRGEPGAVVLGRLKNRRGEPARLWACTFVHEGAAYVTMFATRESTTARDEARLRRVIDATDLTHLEDMSGQGSSGR